MERPTVLLVDDNRDLLHFLERLMAESGWRILSAESAGAALEIAATEEISAALVDYMLPDASGIELAQQLSQNFKMPISLMTNAILAPEEEAICEEHDFPVLRKPFLATDVIRLLRERLQEKFRSVDDAGVSGGTEESQNKALRVFVSYSHRDEIWQKRLANHLSGLKHMGIVQSWHDRQIKAGDNFAATIDKYLNVSDLILLLISPDFMSSEYCYRVEMTRALERHEREEACVIPVILRPVDWERAPFSHIQAVPKDGKAVTLWPNKDLALMDAAKSIRKAAEELSAQIRRS